MNTAITYEPVNDFQEQYIRLRKQEKRLYSEEQVAKLPGISRHHLHYKEWKVRKRSSEKLVNYLEKMRTALQILEVGCGNGWLSAKLAGINHSMVTGIDINRRELNQARKVFREPNLRFIYGELENVSADYDVIVFASSVQYFQSLENIVNKALSLLNKNGEIHILDTFFYDEKEMEGAIRRTKEYYNSIGCDEMAGYYFHRSWGELRSFDYKILSGGISLFDKIMGRGVAFPWIRIHKS